jgi:hypothetical protein
LTFGGNGTFPTLTANFTALGRTPISLAGNGFNSEFWLSPLTWSLCCVAKQAPTDKYGVEVPYAFEMAGYGPGNSGYLPIVDANYLTNISGPSYTNVIGGSGAGAFPANGVLTSPTDART